MIFLAQGLFIIRSLVLRNLKVLKLYFCLSLIWKFEVDRKKTVLVWIGNKEVPSVRIALHIQKRFIAME